MKPLPILCLAGALASLLLGTATAADKAPDRKVEGTTVTSSHDPADAQKHVQRLYWVQFEVFLPDNERTYKYAFVETATLGGKEFDVTRTYAPTNLKSRPGSDRERVFAMIAKAGFLMPTEQANVRLVYLPDEKKRKELMIVYGEDLSMSKSTVEELNTPAGTTKWEGQRATLVERAKEKIKVEF
jgi:hypothetical protein